MTNKWLEWAKRIQAISQNGLTYSKDVFDIERFTALRQMSVEMMAALTQTAPEKIAKSFASGTGYATPKIDMRGVVFKNDQLLFVKERTDGFWSLPGGWADVGQSPSEVVVKEIREEAGYVVTPVKLLAVFDQQKHAHPPSIYHAYKLFILCEITELATRDTTETSDVQFFSVETLPPLSTRRVTRSQIEQMFSFLQNPEQATLFD